MLEDLTANFRAAKKYTECGECKHEARGFGISSCMGGEQRSLVTVNTLGNKIQYRHPELENDPETKKEFRDYPPLCFDVNIAGDCDLFAKRETFKEKVVSSLPRALALKL